MNAINEIYFKDEKLKSVISQLTLYDFNLPFNVAIPFIYEHGNMLISEIKVNEEFMNRFLPIKDKTSFIFNCVKDSRGKLWLKMYIEINPISINDIPILNDLRNIITPFGKFTSNTSSNYNIIIPRYYDKNLGWCVDFDVLFEDEDEELISNDKKMPIEYSLNINT